VVSVSLEKVRENAGQWSKTFHVAFPVIYDPEHKIAKAYNVQGIPFNVVIDREGKIVDVFNGARSDAIDAAAAKLASSK
jgi:peroxiredoxin